MTNRFLGKLGPLLVSVLLAFPVSVALACDGKDCAHQAGGKAEGKGKKDCDCKSKKCGKKGCKHQHKAPKVAPTEAAPAPEASKT
ncbi:hypothetical protein WDW37_18885 [Bdellovibrionota bacterium FG-1]